MSRIHPATTISAVLSIGAAALALALPIASSAQKKATPTKAGPAKAPSFDTDVKPVIEKYCVSCHSDSVPPGGVLLKKGMTGTEATKNAALWQKIAKNVGMKHMPPEGSPQPTADQRTKFVNWIDKAFVQDCRLADPGRVTLRRLNREEYNNTIRDLLKVSVRPADDFPSDDVGYGFDNIGDVLSMSPLLMEKYLAASEKAMKDAIRVPRMRTIQVDGSSMTFKGAAAVREGFLGMNSAATGSASFDVKTNGWYMIKVMAAEQPAGPDHAKMELRLNKDLLNTFDVADKFPKPGVYEYKVKLVPGQWTVSTSFINDYYVDKKDRNLAVYSVSLVGPLEDVPFRTDFQKQYIPTIPANKSEWNAEARKNLQAFADRAYRRPIAKEEMDRLMNIFELGSKSGEGYEKAFQLACQGILCNPNFLYRVELDSSSAKTRTLNPYELASRLSYFLWSSTPDDSLLAAAKSGDLAKPEVMADQVKRMLADPKADALVENFGLQWLQLRKLPYFEPDKKMFPTYSPDLVDAMTTETSMFVKSVMREDRPISEFIDSKYTFLNEALAKHYGITGVTGENFRKVSTEGTGRGGVLTQAAVLTVTSNPTRTSPTKRGKWVLEQILGSPPPPPPPGVGDLKDDKHFKEGMTLRQKMEEHRKNPACATCHTRMDAIGFGFENYDPVGKWRTKDGGSPVDSTATLPGGRKFSGPAQLKTILLENKKEFARNFAEKMMTFALGRGVYESDKCFIDDIVKKAAASDYRFSSIVQGVVASESFKKRTVETK